jgi:3-dehydroquinate synthase
MKKLLVRAASGSSQILVGESIDNLKQYVDARRAVIITDNTVARLYQKQFPNCPVILIDSGEQIKTLETVTTIFNQLVDLEVDRSTLILGIGGGIVCDIAGFVASTYMRGTPFGFVSTTLLSQVDASVGGKNGVNFGGYKNMVGVFNQPAFVVCDMMLLKTLPFREIQCGFAEIIKHGAIADHRMLDFIENHRDAALDLESRIVEHLVYRSIEIKAGVVTRDEREKGERRKLNFGHTFGHAIEKLTGIPHGEAVGIGMVMAAALSVKKGLLAQTRPADVSSGSSTVTACRFGLPWMFPIHAGCHEKRQEARRGEDPFCFPGCPGQCLRGGDGVSNRFPDWLKPPG